jgi:hypothetical protein
MRGVEMKKLRVSMPIAVHPLKAKIWRCIETGKLRTGMSLREIAVAIGEPKASPQQIKHHLSVMVTMGTIDWVNGQYRLEQAK